MSIQLSANYIISGIREDGSREFLAIDSHSGGYGYWTKYPEQARQYKLVDELYKISKNDYLRNGIKSIEILKVVQTATIMHPEDLVAIVTANAEHEINEIKKSWKKK